MQYFFVASECFMAISNKTILKYIKILNEEQGSESYKKSILIIFFLKYQKCIMILVVEDKYIKKRRRFWRRFLYTIC